MNNQAIQLSAITFLGWLFVFANASAMVEVQFEKKGRNHNVRGRVLLEAQDGGILFEARDTQIWAIQPNELKSRSMDDGVPFSRLNRDELKTHLLRQLSSEFKVYETAHYIICYNTSRAYAQWCGALYERLYRAFHNYWRRRGFKLEDNTPLVSIVFRDRANFERYAKVEMGETAKSVIGFYSLQTNLISTYDLTGIGGLPKSTSTVADQRQINRLLSTPQAERTVATVIHEATHQLAFNTGLQVRFADIPIWFSEGLAIYFETPDLKNQRGWSTIGAVNKVRHAQMMKYLRKRPSNSLRSLLAEDTRFRNSHTAEAAYAESWSLCFFLIKHHPKEFQSYLKLLSQKKSLGEDSPAQRIIDFQSAFGKDFEKLDDRFVRFISQLRAGR